MNVAGRAALEIKFSAHTQKKPNNVTMSRMTDVNWTYFVIILQYMQISSQYTVQLKLLYLKTKPWTFISGKWSNLQDGQHVLRQVYSSINKHSSLYLPSDLWRKHK